MPDVPIPPPVPRPPKMWRPPEVMVCTRCNLHETDLPHEGRTALPTEQKQPALVFISDDKVYVIPHTWDCTELEKAMVANP